MKKIISCLIALLALINIACTKKEEIQSYKDFPGYPEDSKVILGSSKLYMIQGRYLIQARHSGKCLEVADWGTHNGAVIQQATCIGPANKQQFIIEYAGDYKHRIRNGYSNKVIEVEGGSPNIGAGMIQWDYWGGNNQLWYIKAPKKCAKIGGSSSCGYKFAAVHSGFVFDIAHGSKNDGVRLIQWEDVTAGEQEFYLIPRD